MELNQIMSWETQGALNWLMLVAFFNILALKFKKLADIARLMTYAPFLPYLIAKRSNLIKPGIIEVCVFFAGGIVSLGATFILIGWLENLIQPFFYFNNRIIA